MQSGERRGLEETALVAALTEQIDRLRGRDEWQQLACLELLLVRGWSNQQVAATLGQSQQTVANTKSEFLERLRVAGPPTAARSRRVSRVVSAMTIRSLTDAELLAYLDEALPAETMAEIERWLRGDAGRPGPAGRRSALAAMPESIRSAKSGAGIT